MAWLITKYLFTAAVVVLVSEFAKRSDKLGGLVAALPMVTVLALIWLYVEKQPLEKIANHAWYTFWVCGAHAAHVFDFSSVVAAYWFLAHAGGVRSSHRGVFCPVRTAGTPLGY